MYTVVPVPSPSKTHRTAPAPSPVRPDPPSFTPSRTLRSRCLLGFFELLDAVNRKPLLAIPHSPTTDCHSSSLACTTHQHSLPPETTPPLPAAPPPPNIASCCSLGRPITTYHTSSSSYPLTFPLFVLHQGIASLFSPFTCRPSFFCSSRTLCRSRVPAAFPCWAPSLDQRHLPSPSSPSLPLSLRTHQHCPQDTGLPTPFCHLSNFPTYPSSTSVSP